MKKSLILLLSLTMVSSFTPFAQAATDGMPSNGALQYANDIKLTNCFDIPVMQKKQGRIDWSKMVTLPEAACLSLVNIGITRDMSIKSTRTVKAPFDLESTKAILRPYLLNAYRFGILPENAKPDMRFDRSDAAYIVLRSEGIAIPLMIDERMRTYEFKDITKNSQLESIMLTAINRGILSAVNATTSGARSQVSRGDFVDMLYKSMLVSESERAFEMSQALPAITILPQESDIPHMDTFYSVWDIATNNHIDKESFNKDKAAFDAINGFLKGFDDPYTALMTPDENQSFQDTIGGSLEGIGAYITKEKDLLTIVSPIKKSPAEAAGLLSGDIILKIDDKETKDLTLQESVNKIKGPKDSKVTLSIQRGEKAPFDVTITRAKIDISSVELEFRDGIAYINLYQFGENTVKEWNEAIKKIQETGASGIILDLRNNPGGLLTSVEQMLGDFVEKGKTILKIEYGNVTEVVTSAGDAKLKRYPLAVIINKGSASASEILAGAIKDLKLGTIIGEKSFGKGTVQELTQFFDGSSLRLTIAKWLTPDGTSINKNGIEPDIRAIDNPDTKEDEIYTRALQELKF